MTIGKDIAKDPFVDTTTVSENELDLTEDSTLTVGREASLTLGTDSLIVLGRPVTLSHTSSRYQRVIDNGLAGTKRANCCGLIPSGISIWCLQYV